MEVGIVGKPNVGKSTFFNTATLSKAEVASYPFTTVDANRAVGFIRTKCVCKEFNVECNPKNSKCVNGDRFIPIKIIDVAGLVPGAHEGKGLGNKFLDELRQAAALVHVVDISGGTDEKGNIVAIGSHNPVTDVRFLEKEIEEWFFTIFKRNWSKISKIAKLKKKSFSKLFEELFVGIGIKEWHVAGAVKELDLNLEEAFGWSEETLFEFSKVLRRISKPIIISANKSDVEIAEENLRKMREELKDLKIIPTSSMAELLLKELEREGAVRYTSGDEGFEVVDRDRISEKHEKALEIIKGKVFDRFGDTGVQQCINEAVFKILNKIVVYPVEDENKLTDKKGNVLPDAFVLDSGSTPKDLAEKIHTDIAQSYIGAIDARTKKKVSKDYKLKNLDVIKILAG